MSDPSAGLPVAPPATLPGPEPAASLPTAAQLDELEADLDRVDEVLAQLDEEH